MHAPGRAWAGTYERVPGVTHGGRPVYKRVNSTTGETPYHSYPTIEALTLWELEHLADQPFYIDAMCAQRTFPPFCYSNMLTPTGRRRAIGLLMCLETFEVWWDTQNHVLEYVYYDEGTREWRIGVFGNWYSDEQIRNGVVARSPACSAPSPHLAFGLGVSTEKPSTVTTSRVTVTPRPPTEPYATPGACARWAAAARDSEAVGTGSASAFRTPPPPPGSAHPPVFRRR